MGVHDWTGVEAGIFHDFHTIWISEFSKAFNSDLLSKGYYALIEQHTGKTLAGILRLRARSPDEPQQISSESTTVVLQAPPRVRMREVVKSPLTMRQRTLAIRHVSGHELIAMIEIVSPGNKDRPQHIQAFAAKAADAIHEGIHLLVIDLFPPGPNDPCGMHGAIRQYLSGSDAPYELPPAEPMTLASYVVSFRVEAYLEHLAVGSTLPEMPLFLGPSRYINVPLAATYEAAWRGVPSVWRDVIEARKSG